MLAASYCVKFGNTKKNMSRIGYTPISIPDGVTVTVTGDQVEVKGSKGQLQAPLKPGIEVAVADGEVKVTRKNELKQTKAYHGLVRSLINNAIIGVTEGYQKTLKLVGVGYRVAMKGQGLSLSVGFSHPVEIEAPAGITFKLEGNDTIHVSGIDKELVGQISADIRKVRPPEPYKGKGIKYDGEVIQRKAGKTAAA